MDFKMALALSLPIGLGLAALGSGIGLGRAVGSAMDAIGRQPMATTTSRTEPHFMLNITISFVENRPTQQAPSRPNARSKEKAV